MLEQKILTNARIYLHSGRLWPTGSLWSRLFTRKKHHSEMKNSSSHPRGCIIPLRVQWKNARYLEKTCRQPSATQGWSIDPSVCYVRCGEMESVHKPSQPTVLLWLRTRLTAVGREKAAASSDTAVGHSEAQRGPAGETPDQTGPSLCLSALCSWLMVVLDWRNFHSLRTFPPVGRGASANFCNLRTATRAFCFHSAQRQRSTVQCATHAAFANVIWCKKIF